MAMANPNMHNLTTLIKRLEAATSRLEDLASTGSSVDSGSLLSSSSGLVPSTSSIETPPTPPAPAANGSTAGTPLPADPPSIQDFDALINSEVKQYVTLSESLGGLVELQAQAVQRCFLEQRRFLLIATKAKKPDPSSSVFSDLLARMQKEMMQVTELRESNRGSPVFNHLSVVSDGIPAVAWVTYDDPPAFVNMMLEAAQYYGDKILKASKNEDKKHVEWVKSFRSLLVALTAYTRKHHTKSLHWNPDGLPAKEAAEQIDAQSKASSAPSSSASASTATFSSSVAPPPPPPLPQFDGEAETPVSKPASINEGISGVFAQLNNPNVTANLKKVDKSQMTHKNQSLRASGVVPARSDSTGSTSSLRAKSPAPPHKPGKPAHMKTKKPPKKELDGNKWIIENFEDNHEIILSEDDTEIHHSVLLYRCKNATLKIHGKINAMTMNDCTKLNVIVESLVSSIDVIKSHGFAIQVLKKVPTIQVDGCDGGTIYLGRESIGAEVFTSKSTALNVLWQEEEGDEAEFVERPVPEQLKHVVGRRGLESSIVEHVG